MNEEPKTVAELHHRISELEQADITNKKRIADLEAQYRKMQEQFDGIRIAVRRAEHKADSNF